MATFTSGVVTKTFPDSGSFLPTDVLTIDSSLSAADFVVSTSGSDLVLTFGSEAFTLTGFAINNLSLTNVAFADGSILAYGDGAVGDQTLDDDADTLTGGDYDDYLDGAGGDDTLIGGDGDDILIGGAGTGDTASYAGAAFGVTVDLSSTNAQNTIGAGTDKLSGIENLIGTAHNDTLTGDSNANTLTGNGGNDVLIGGDGDDTYVISAGYALITDTAGTDTVKSGVDFTLGTGLENLTLTGTGNINGRGNSGANTIIGNGGNNILDGQGGSDNLQGGTGNDTYILHTGNETVTDTGGVDLVRIASTYNLTAHTTIENLLLTGTGNADSTGANNVANVIYANKGLNDLDGGTGTVLDTVSFQYGALGGVGVTASLQGAAETTVIGSKGDTISNFENLIGTNYADTLRGDQGTAATAKNVLTGLNGNDTYYVSGTTTTNTDSVVEAANGGTDTVNSSATSFTLSVNVENLVLSTGAVTGIGNSSNNTLTGNGLANTLKGGAGVDTISGGDGADTIYGEVGNDILNGGAGADNFVFNTTLSATANKDTINGYVAADDTIQLENAIFKKLLTVGALDSTSFKVGVAADANDYILYNSTTGVVSYDADGNGAGAAVAFVTLTGAPTITAADFSVI